MWGGGGGSEKQVFTKNFKFYAWYIYIYVIDCLFYIKTYCGPFDLSRGTDKIVTIDVIKKVFVQLKKKSKEFSMFSKILRGW